MKPKLNTYTEKQKQSKAYKFFNSLQYGEHCKDWKQFELYIMDCFTNAGYTVITDMKKCELQAKDEMSLKDYIKLKKPELKDDLTVVNELKHNYKNIVIYQPFGTTASPDFIWMTPNYIVPIECKVSHKQTPKWNSLPTEDTLIIFASTKDKIITYFWGYQVLNTMSRKELSEIRKKMDKLWKGEYEKTENLKASNLKIYFNFSDFTDNNNYSSHELNLYRQDYVLKMFVNDK